MDTLTITLLAMLFTSWWIIINQTQKLSDMRKFFIDLALLRGIDDPKVTEVEWAEAHKRLRERSRKSNGSL